MNNKYGFIKKHCKRIMNICKYSFCVSVTILTFCVMFINDEFILKKEEDFVKLNWLLNIDKDYKPFFYKLFFFIFIFLIFAIGLTFYYALRIKRKINGIDYSVEIRYSDVFSIKNCIPVVNSDECFTSKLGDAPGDIKPSSTFGQYLLKHQDLDMLKIIKKNQIKPEDTRSKFKNQVCYKPGTILYNDDALILAFARLDNNGCAEFKSLEDYMNCLSYMWQEIKSKHGDRNVAISVLGSGRTKICGVALSKQEILDYLILSYKLSYYKLQRNYKLIICCDRDSISLDNIRII